MASVVVSPPSPGMYSIEPANGATPAKLAD
jgi:hypothetical protein